MEEKKRILITGASGFIGGFLVKEALKRGYDVWAGIRQGSSREHLTDERLHFIDLQYNNEAELTKQLREVVSFSGAWHFVVHNAGITKSLHTADFYKVNASYVKTLIESLANADCKPEKFLLMSSLSSYGPVAEHSFRPIRIDDEQRPDSMYGKSKLHAEHFLKIQTHFPYIILCPTGVYGPGDKDYLMEIKSIKSGIDLKVGMKPQRISFIFAEDLAVATFLALENPAACNTAYFVADGDVYTDHEFAAIVKKLLGKHFVVNLRIPMWMCYVACACSEFAGKILKKPMTLNMDKYKILRQRNWVCETDRTFCDLGFIPLVNLEKGLEKTILYNKKHGFL